MKSEVKLNQSGFGLAGVAIIILAIVVVILGGWRVWDAVHSSKPATKTSQQPKPTGASVVLNASQGTPDLVAFLKSDGEGCRANNPNEFKIIKELPGRFAKMSFGCGNTDAYIFAQFKQNKWSLISPTNQFMPDGTPSCQMVYEYSISNKIAPKCAALGQSQYQDNPYN